MHDKVSMQVFPAFILAFISLTRFWYLTIAIQLPTFFPARQKVSFIAASLVTVVVRLPFGEGNFGEKLMVDDANGGVGESLYMLIYTKTISPFSRQEWFFMAVNQGNTTQWRHHRPTYTRTHAQRCGNMRDICSQADKKCQANKQTSQLVQWERENND